MTESAAHNLAVPALEPIYRRNFVYFLLDGILFTVAMSLIGSTTVIPDFIRHLTDSRILIGLSGSLFTIGFTLPQLWIARHIVRFAHKKWWFVGPNIPVRFVIFFFALIIVWVGDKRPTLLLWAFFIAYGIAAFGDGLVGVPWADLSATSLDNRWRARMFGLTTVITGLLMLVLAPLISVILGPKGLAFPNNYALLFGAAGVIFVISILPGLFFHELPGGKVAEKSPDLSEFLPELGRVVRNDGPFRAFISVRMLTTLFMMAAPFYVVYATEQLGLASGVAVPVLLAMQTIGSLVGALVYTWMGERNNVLYIRLALASAVLLPVCALISAPEGTLFGAWPLYFGFLVSGLANGSNLFNCFMNWVVIYAHPDQRPIYVGLANTISALMALISPFLGGVIAQELGYRTLFVCSLLLALIALLVSLRSLRDQRAEEVPVMAVTVGQ
ncbi:MAG: MFS transporter [Caldilineaceae bacterium]